MKVELRTFAEWCGADQQYLQGQVSGVKIDSRHVMAGDVFFALRGARVNGEDYVEQALQKGAVSAVVSSGYQEARTGLIVVADVAKALAEAARHYRATLKSKIVAITGSVGKTTTKQICLALLKQKYHTYANQGNYNNELGLPLTIFQIDDTIEWTVLEMGMNHSGEIAMLSGIAQQDIAAITNIGTAHIEYFGSRQGIAEAKFEITSVLSEKDLLVVNAKDDILAAYHSAAFDVLKTGRVSDRFYSANVSTAPSGMCFDLYTDGVKTNVTIPLYGSHNVDNAVLAAAIAYSAGLSPNQIKRGLTEIKAPNMRFEMTKIADYTFINDAYNASFDSIVASVETFMQLNFSQRIAVIGDVLECGEQARAIHSEIGKVLNNYPLDYVLFVGEEMRAAYQNYRASARHYDSVADIAHPLAALLKPSGAVLLKGSRALALEKIQEDFRRNQLNE